MDADQVCRSEHGIYASYDGLSNRCECDSGYTLDDSRQCVKKQNNVYFLLKEVDTDNNKAIIRSEYDNRYYVVSYGFGCYDGSFKRYVGHRLVVNLGTDFDLDTWDKIVLQDDDEVCDVTRVERGDSGSTFVVEDDSSSGLAYVPPH